MDPDESWSLRGKEDGEGPRIQQDQRLGYVSSGFSQTDMEKSGLMGSWGQQIELRRVSVQRDLEGAMEGGGELKKLYDND